MSIYMKFSRLMMAAFLVMVLAVTFAWTREAAGADDGYGYRSPVHRDGPARYGQGGHGSGLSWTVRVLTNQDLERISARDRNMSPSVVKRLLAKLNVRDFDYIDEDIRLGRPIKVPNDFGALKTWTPLQRYLPEVSSIPKFVLIAKDKGYIGWYERGRLVGDTYICIGRQDDMTAAGIYPIRQKDRDHVSKSYPNAYGEPAPMPWAMRIYELIWIHAGDITGPNCSHGCINLPIEPATSLFKWAALGTPVMIVDNLRDVPTIVARNRSNCTLFASTCTLPVSSRPKI